MYMTWNDLNRNVFAKYVKHLQIFFIWMHPFYSFIQILNVFLCTFFTFFFWFYCGIGTEAETSHWVTGIFGRLRLLCWLMLKGSADLTEPQTHLPLDTDTEVMKAFHSQLLMIGGAQPKPKLWPFAVGDCSLFPWEFLLLKRRWQ